MKDKHIVKPIDSSNWEQKDPIKHNHKQKSSLGSSIFAIIFLIWFFGSIVAMMIFADINEYITLILFGQVFFIMGLVAFFAKDISGKRVNLIGLPFIIVGLLCIVIPLCILFPNILPVEVKKLVVQFLKNDANIQHRKSALAVFYAILKKNFSNHLYLVENE